MNTVGNFLRTQMQERGLLQKNLAIQLGIDDRTFRTRLNRNQFTRPEVDQIIRILHLKQTADDLLRDYEFDGGSFMEDSPRRGRPGAKAGGDIWSAISAADAAAKREAARAEQMLGLYEHVLRSMTSQGLHIISTQTATPIEMEDTPRGIAWRPAMLAAIRQGGTFVYIRPDDDLLEHFNDTWKFQRTIPMDEAVREFDAFREWMVKRLVADRLPVTTAEKTIDRQVAQIYCNEFPYFAPGFSMCLIHEADDYRRTKQRLTVRAPGVSSFSWIDHELHVFRYVSAARKVIEDHVPKDAKGRKAGQHMTIDVCCRALRMLNEHFGLESET